MKLSHKLLIASGVITLIGLITGRFLFLVLLIPLNLFNFRKNKNSEE